MILDRARKAQVVAVSGMTTWAATFLPAIWAGLIGVVSATYLAWLVPREDAPDEIGRQEWQPPERGSVSLATALLLGFVAVCLLVLLWAMSLL